jgi:hypothetical protein
VVPFCGEFVAGFNVNDVFGEGLVEWVGTAGERVRIECGTCVQWRLPSVADHIVRRNVSDRAIVGLEKVSGSSASRVFRSRAAAQEPGHLWCVLVPLR